VSILTLQRRMREIGRIRTGETVVGSGGRKRPVKLSTFKLTAPNRALLESAAEVYQGEVTPFEAGGWQLTTNVDSLDIVVPPGQAISQWFEMWSGGGCQRRCDGIRETLTDQPCLCPQDDVDRRDAAQKGLACKPTTRLNVILPLLPDVGVWRLEAHGYYAAVELAGTAEFLERATATGTLIPARLRLDQREQKRPGEATKQYSVPVIELPQTKIGELIDLAGGPVVPMLPGGQERPNLRQRVERPALGEPPPLPTDRPFTKPVAPFGEEPEMPTTVAFAPMEDDPAPEPIAPVPGQRAAFEDEAPTDTRTDDPGAPGASTGPTALPLAAFIAETGRRKIPTRQVAAYAKRDYGTTDLAALTDEDRAALLAALTA
jgi:hypothetical protein